MGMLRTAPSGVRGNKVGGGEIVETTGLGRDGRPCRRLLYMC